MPVHACAGDGSAGHFTGAHVEELRKYGRSR